MQITHSLPSLPSTLWPGVVAPDRILSMDQTELNSVLIQNWIAWNRTVLTNNPRRNGRRKELENIDYWLRNPKEWLQGAWAEEGREKEKKKTIKYSSITKYNIKIRFRLSPKFCMNTKIIFNFINQLFLKGNVYHTHIHLHAYIWK